MSIERFISQRAIEWFCNEVSEYPVDKVFNDIFSEGQDFSGFLKRISKRQAMRFLELVERTDDIEKWLAFLEHEQKREKSEWKDNLIKEKFIPNVKIWLESSHAGCVREAEQILQRWHGHSDVSLTPEEKNMLKIKALRTAFYVILKGIV